MPAALRRLLALLALLPVLLGTTGGARAWCDATHADAHSQTGHHAPAHRHDAPRTDACVAGWHCATATAPAPEAPAAPSSAVPATPRLAAGLRLPAGPDVAPEPPPPRA